MEKLNIVELIPIDVVNRITLTEEVNDEILEDFSSIPDDQYVMFEGGIRAYYSSIFTNERHVDEFIIESNLDTVERVDEIREYLTEADYNYLRQHAPNFVYKNGETLRDRAKATNKGSYFANVDKDGIIVYKTPSYTKSGITYMQLIKLVKLPELYKQYRDTKSLPDIIKMAIMDDIMVHCTDPSWLYWGFKFMGTEQDYAVHPERRPPDIRNPGRLGSVCKHLDNVLLALPFNTVKIAKKMKERNIFDVLDKVTSGASDSPKPPGEVIPIGGRPELDV